MLQIAILINTYLVTKKRGNVMSEKGSITKETHLFANQLNLVLDEVQVQSMDVVLVCRSYKEPLFALFHGLNGSFSWKENVCLPQAIKEELPAFYVDEESLRIMLGYVAKELKYELDNI